MGKMLSFHFSSSYEDEQVMDEVVKVPLVQHEPYFSLIAPCPLHQLISDLVIFDETLTY